MDLARMLIKFCVTMFFLKYFKFRNLIKKQRKYQNLKPISKSIFVNLNTGDFGRYSNEFFTKDQNNLLNFCVTAILEKLKAR